MTEHVHWKKLTNPDFIGSYAFDHGEEKTATIKDVKQELVVGADGKKETCTVVHFAENLKPLILNRTNAKTITKLYGTGFIDEWVGKKITMTVRNVRAFGETVEAIRIKPEVPKDKKVEPIKCTDCGKTIQAVGTYSAESIAQINKTRFGRVLCAECSKKLSELKAETKPQEPEEQKEMTTAQKLTEALKGAE